VKCDAQVQRITVGEGCHHTVADDDSARDQANNHSTTQCFTQRLNASLYRSSFN